MNVLQSEVVVVVCTLSSSATSPILPCTHVKSSVIIIEWPLYTISGNGEGQGYTILPVRSRCLCVEKMGYVSVGHLLSWIIPKHMALKNIV